MNNRFSAQQPTSLSLKSNPSNSNLKPLAEFGSYAARALDQRNLLPSGCQPNSFFVRVVWFGLRIVCRLLGFWGCSVLEVSLSAPELYIELSMLKT